jgi:hypothetical protein
MAFPQPPPPSPPPSPASTAPDNQRGIIIAASVGVAILTVIGVLVARDAGTEHRSSLPESTLDSGTSSTDSTPRVNRDHFHAAYSVNLCGVEQPPLTDAHPDVHGIHTHGDGVIHVHPFDQSVAGNRATLSAFFQQVDVTLTDSELRLPDGRTRTAGQDTCGGQEAELVVLVWANARDADEGLRPDETHTVDMGRVRLRDAEAITIAFRPKGVSVPGPRNAVDRLTRLNDAPPPRGLDPTTTSTSRPTATSTT